MIGVDVTHYIYNRSSNNMALKLDMAKTFEHVDLDLFRMHVAQV